jgi:hypothetical protein
MRPEKLWLHQLVKKFVVFYEEHNSTIIFEKNPRYILFYESWIYPTLSKKNSSILILILSSRLCLRL